MSADIETLRAALSKMHAYATGQSRDPYMSIPARPDLDADLLLADAIRELGELRVKHAELVILYEGINQSHTETTQERDAAHARCSVLRERLETCARNMTSRGAAGQTVRPYTGIFDVLNDEENAGLLALRSKLVEFGHRLVAKQLEGAGCAGETSEGIAKTMSEPIEALAEEFTR